MNPGTMGGHGYGMHPGMMRGYGMGPGMRGYYSPEQYEKQFKEHQDFLDETRELRKKLHTLKFDFAEARRNPDAKRDDLERRVHDLKLTRQVTMQSLPSVRLVQENDKALVSKIGSTMANTIPLWRQQLAMAVTIARSAEAGETLKDATDLTNELLTANADALRALPEFAARAN